MTKLSKTQEAALAPIDKAKHLLISGNPAIVDTIQRAALAVQKVTVVSDEIAKAELTAYVKNAKDVRAQLEKLRKGETGKLDDAKKLIMQAEKDLAAQLDRMIASGTKLITDYNNEVIRKQKEENDRIEAERKKALSRLSSPASIAAVETKFQAQAQTVAAPTGTSTAWQIEITNKALVPIQYMIVDEAAIRKAIKEGVREIPGVKLKQVKKTVIR